MVIGGDWCGSDWREALMARSRLVPDSPWLAEKVSPSDEAPASGPEVGLVGTHAPGQSVAGSRRPVLLRFQAAVQSAMDDTARMVLAVTLDIPETSREAPSLGRVEGPPRGAAGRDWSHGPGTASPKPGPHTPCADLMSDLEHHVFMEQLNQSYITCCNEERMGHDVDCRFSCDAANMQNWKAAVEQEQGFQGDVHKAGCQERAEPCPWCPGPGQV